MLILLTSHFLYAHVLKDPAEWYMNCEAAIAATSGTKAAPHSMPHADPNIPHETLVLRLYYTSETARASMTSRNVRANMSLTCAESLACLSSKAARRSQCSMHLTHSRPREST